MNDDDRMRLATSHGNHWYGPVERARCSRHPTRWTTYRWEWFGHRDDISGGEPVVVRSCAACLDDDRRMEDE